METEPEATWTPGKPVPPGGGLALHLNSGAMLYDYGFV